MNEPIWTPRPAQRPKKPTADLIRVPAGGTLRGIITSQTPTGAYTHFWNNRTLPCAAEGCPACDADQRPRWLGYISIWNPKTQKHAILELTQNAITPIFDHLDKGETLRGQEITVTRHGHRPNGRVKVTIDGDASPAYAIPAGLPVEEILKTIWDLENAAEGRENSKYEHAAHDDLETQNGRKRRRG